MFSQRTTAPIGPVPARPARTLASLVVRLAGAWWRSILPLAASCAVIAAVVGGACGVGDGIRRGLAGRVDDQLGGILATVSADRFFDVGLAERAAAGGLPEGIDRLEPAIVLGLSVEPAGGEGGIARGTLLAVADPRSLGWPDAPPPLPADTVAINRPLADALRLSVGDAVVLRAADRSAIPSESPLGKRVVGTLGRRVTVGRILAPRGIGSFALSPSQREAPLVISSLQTAGALLRRTDAATIVFAIGRPGAADASATAARWLADAVHPTLADYGLAIERVGPRLARLSSASLLVPPEADRAAAQVLQPLGAAATLLVLANDIVAGSPTRVDAGDAGAAHVPYSTVAGIAGTDLPFGRLLDAEGTLLPAPRDGEIVIDQWLADDLAAQGKPVGIGSSLIVRWFAPETLHGRIEERSRTFTVGGIARMEEAAVERSIVPEVDGITDKRSIAGWDPPFPFDASRVRTTPPHDEDDRYWKDHGATPKAFVSLDEARRMAAARFGRTTAWHVPLADGAEVGPLADRLAAAIGPEAMGFRFRAVRREADAAAAGSTPFAPLFLALSSFVVVSGFMLEWLLATLLVATRRKPIGLLSAIGWTRWRIAAVFGGVGAIASAVGCVIGAAIGPAWSAVLLRMLSGGVGGVGEAAGGGVFAASPVRAGTVAAVAVGTFLTAAIAPWVVAYSTARGEAAPLLAGAGRGTTPATKPRRRGWGIAFAGALAAALLLAVTASPVADEAGRFFAAGGLALLGMLGFVRTALEPAAVRSTWGLVRRGLVLEPGRTLAVVALVGVAEFLVVAVSAFALSPPEDPRDRKSATGGWTLVATLNEPCGIDLLDRSQLDALGLATDGQEILLAAEIARLRASDGDDASCLNLFRAGNPTVLGVDRQFRDCDPFRFTASRAAPGESPWRLLERPRLASDPVPVIVDEATARYALGLSGVGGRIEVADGTGGKVDLEVVGLLSPGILQGYLVIADEDFVRLFPGSAGYSLVLLRPETSDEPSAAAFVSRALADFGPTVVTSVDRLRSLNAVQNTYLSGFQTLGVLGLLLGTAGIAAVQVRGVLERAAEFGLLTALGFTPDRIGRLVAAETLVQVGLGLAVGAAAAGIAVWPQFAAGRAGLPVGWAAASSLGTLSGAMIVSLAVAAAAAGGRPSEAMRAP